MINWRKFFTVVEDGGGEVLQMDSKKKKKKIGKRVKMMGRRTLKTARKLFNLSLLVWV